MRKKTTAAKPDHALSRNQNLSFKPHLFQASGDHLELQRINPREQLQHASPIEHKLRSNQRRPHVKFSLFVWDKIFLSVAPRTVVALHLGRVHLEDAAEERIHAGETSLLLLPFEPLSDTFTLFICCFRMGNKAPIAQPHQQNTKGAPTGSKVLFFLSFFTIISLFFPFQA